MEKGIMMKIMGMTTRTEYKVANGLFCKRKVRLSARGHQQVEGLQFNQRDIYLLVLKSAEVCRMVAIAAHMDLRFTQRIRREPFAAATWRRTCTCRPQTGGLSLFQRDTASISKKKIYGTPHIGGQASADCVNTMQTTMQTFQTLLDHQK